jgi:hypothetical protein
MAWLSGWRDLVPVLSAGKNLREERFRFVSGELRKGSIGIRYNNCLRIGVGETGLSLDVMPVLRPAHPPLFIPWERVGLWYPRTHFWRKGVQLMVDGVGVCVWGRSGEAVYWQLVAARARAEQDAEQSGGSSVA